MTATTRQRRQAVPPEPEFSNSQELRVFLDNWRRAMHAGAMMAHQAQAEIEAALSTIPPREPRMFSRSIQRRRARRVARHMGHAAECMVASSAAAVRTWGAFRAEFAPELSPVRRRRSAFTVIPE